MSIEDHRSKQFKNEIVDENIQYKETKEINKLFLAFDATFFNKSFIKWHDDSIISISSFRKSFIVFPKIIENSKLSRSHCHWFFDNIPIHIFSTWRNSSASHIREINLSW